MGQEYFFLVNFLLFILHYHHQLYLLSEFVTFSGNSGLKKESDSKGVKKRSMRADGTVLHCVAISVYCFKLGRITVPPRVALSICGIGASNSDGTRVSLMKQAGKLRYFLETGWRDEGGWDLPEFEMQRLGGLEWCRKLTDGIREAVSVLE